MLENVGLQFRNQLVEIQDARTDVVFVARVTILDRLSGGFRLQRILTSHVGVW
jgi:hypothetical protein